MCHTRLNRIQMGSENQILAGGKVVFRGGWKFGNREVVQWLLFVQWTTFDQGFFRGKIGCCKSFEGFTYNDKKNGQEAERWPELRWQK
ncbi:MAG: hypothetical protein COA78_27055 [Blastopirellula sp.]|nr:MAG: hypothetical protein COA78_27055 [Blastopirellula sp.]